MKNTIVKLILFVAVIALVVKCTDVPLSDNLKTTIPQLDGTYEYEDKLVVKFELRDDNTVLYTQYDPDGKGNFESPSDKYDLPVYFTDIKYKGKIHHFISVKYDPEIFITKKIEFENGNILVTSLNDDFIMDNHKENFLTPENFKKFILENMKNPELFEKGPQLFTPRGL